MFRALLLTQAHESEFLLLVIKVTEMSLHLILQQMNLLEPSGQEQTKAQNNYETKL